MHIEKVEKKLNEFITKVCELRGEIIKLLQAAYHLKQEINDEKKIQTDNKKLGGKE